MLTVESPITPLPPEPTSYEEWCPARPNYPSAYDKIFKVERPGVYQVQTNPISGGVAGYLFNRRPIEVRDGAGAWRPNLSQISHTSFKEN